MNLHFCYKFYNLLIHTYKSQNVLYTKVYNMIINIV